MDPDIDQLRRLSESLRAELANEHDAPLVGDLLRYIVRHETRLAKLERAAGSDLTATKHGRSRFPPMSSMLEQIREAIRNARRISFYAYGHQRVVYPYILGTKEGDWNLIAWQINDASRSRFRRGRPRWRCFEVSAIRNLQPAEGEWVRAWFNGPEKDWVDWVDTMVPEPFAAQDPANPSLYLPLISLRIRVPNFLVSAARRLPEIAGKIRLKKPGAMTQSEPSERPRPNELRSEAVADVPEPQRHNAGTRAAMEQAAKKNAEIMAAIRKLADDGVTLASCRSRREFAAKVRHELGQRPSSRG